MSTKTCQAEMTTVFFATVDGATSGTISVLTTGSPSSPEGALKTHLQSTFGWRPDDIVLEMYEPDKYVILFDTVASKFIREECSVAAATTEADKYTVQKELCAYIKRDNIRELDLNEIYSHYNIIYDMYKCFRRLHLVDDDNHPIQRDINRVVCFPGLHIVDDDSDPGQCNSNWGDTLLEVAPR